MLLPQQFAPQTPKRRRSSAEKWDRKFYFLWGCFARKLREPLETYALSGRKFRELLYQFSLRHQLSGEAVCVLPSNRSEWIFQASINHSLQILDFLNLGFFALFWKIVKWKYIHCCVMSSWACMGRTRRDAWNECSSCSSCLLDFFLRHSPIVFSISTVPCALFLRLLPLTACFRRSFASIVVDSKYKSSPVRLSN